MPKRITALDRIHVASPCSADWDEMAGNEQIRFCQHCSQHVHDLSKITRKDVMRLVAASKGSLCVRYQRRPDGTVQTAARAEPLTQIKRRLSRIAAGAFTASLGLAQSVAAQTARPAAGERPAALQQATLGRILVKPVPSAAPSSLYGTVFDPQQAVVPAAQVTLVNTATGQEQTAVSDDQGVYQFPAVEAGTYVLRVSAPGFALFQQEQVVLREGASERVDATLSVAEILGGAIVIVPSTPLIRAVWDENMDEVKNLLAGGVDVNATDEGVEMTALGAAVSTGKLEFVQALIDAGADPNGRSNGGRTPLMSLDEDATAEIVRALVAAGARVNLRDEEGNSALHVAARLEKSDVLRALLDAGGSVNGTNKEGLTPLMAAADTGYLENVKVLLWAGADTNLRNNDGKTALALAEDSGREAIVALLKAYGAEE